jgi:alpha-L-fucosidase
VLQAAACPVLSELGLYAEPTVLGSPRIARDKQGLVTLALDHPGPHIHYTLNGSEPTPESALFEKPFPLPSGGTVRARAFAPENGTTREKAASDIATESFGIAKGKWSVVSASYQSPGGGEAARAIDDRPETLWNTHGPQGERKPPQEIVVDMGEMLSLAAFTYLPRRDGLAKGMVDKFEVYLSEDGRNWGQPALTGEFPNIKANPIQQTMPFKKPVTARYFRFVATRVAEGNHVAVAELGMVGQPSR